MGRAVAAVVTDQFVLLFCSVAAGSLLGKLRVGRFQLGTSGSLFTGLFLGWIVVKYFVHPFAGSENSPPYVTRLVSEGVVSKSLFYLTLVFFIATVGMMAGRDLRNAVRRYGVLFVALGFTVPLFGAALCYLFVSLGAVESPFTIAGVYTGALTSSPGLAAALESAGAFGRQAEALVGSGHAVAYAPGVITVILAVYFLPLVFRIDVSAELEALREILEKKQEQAPETRSAFNLIAFILVCLAGYLLGSIRVHLGKLIGWFSISATGGVLILALAAGYIGSRSRLPLVMDGPVACALRELNLSCFLAVTGLRYGFAAVESFSAGGLILILLSFGAASTSIFLGFLLGRFVFKLNWILLSGSLCGSMTSTPGLGAAIEASCCDDVAIGYGSSYPFALLAMVLFTILLQRFTL
jgi:putative transport protein